MHARLNGRPLAVQLPDEDNAIRRPGRYTARGFFLSTEVRAQAKLGQARRTTDLTLQHIIDNRAALLAGLKRHQGIVRDLTRGVARQYATGLYLFGRPGTAKTHTVRGLLEREIREPYTYQRGHLTPMGLFELIAATT